PCRRRPGPGVRLQQHGAVRLDDRPVDRDAAGHPDRRRGHPAAVDALRARALPRRRRHGPRSHRRGLLRRGVRRGPRSLCTRSGLRYRPAMEIYHLTHAADWDAAQIVDSYEVSTRGANVQQMGFIHCSTAAQLPVVARNVYGSDPAPLVVLVMDDDTIRAAGTEVRYEE